ncbi:MAG TPA: DUF885 family protein, partial [Chitinophagaceae bacterium]|nr:DUF885 family protein [Chitinophagaceae bacterium]
MKSSLMLIPVFSLLLIVGCNSKKESPASGKDKAFAAFEDRFLDAYWNQYPAGSIGIGYGKYYDKLPVPDSAYYAGVISFSNRWIDSLESMDLNSLSDNNKISYHIIKNQLESDRWYTETFKQQEWDASIYNISGSCDYILNQPWAPLAEKLRTLTAFLKSSGDYYHAAFANLHEPTKEHLGLAIQQNQGGLSLFGKALEDSIAASQLSTPEKQQLQQGIDQAVAAMKGFISSLQSIQSDKNYKFRDFRIGKQLFSEKFKYDIATDLTPEQVYDKAVEAKHYYHRRMFILSDSVWTKYYPNQPKPQDSLALIQMVLNKVQLEHPKPADFFDTVNNQVHRLKRFIVEKDLFDFDTAATPIVVRYMPEYARGFSSANA